MLTMTKMRARRLELQLSQRDVATRSGVANADICRFETRMAVPYDGQAKRLARVLHLSADELVQLVELQPVVSEE